MNDGQLVHALRNLDRPVEPDAAFTDTLFGRLQRQALRTAKPWWAVPRIGQLAPAVRMALMLALLLIGLLASALAVGALLRLLPDEPPSLLYVGASDGIYVAAEGRREPILLRGDGTYIEPRVSASGRYIAAGFVNVNDLVALRFLTPDGELAGQLIGGGSDIRAWSPTTDELVLIMPAAARAADEIGRIAIVRPDGSLARIFDLPGRLVPHAVDWAPDGSRLALAAVAQEAGEPVTELWVAQAADGDAHLLISARGAEINVVRWSPEGTRLAFVALDRASGEAALNVIRVDGSDSVVLSDAFPLSGSIDWSPDGDRLVFAREVSEQSDLFTIGSDGSDLVRLTNDPLDDLHPRWSQDGHEIAFERREMRSDGTGGRSETWVIKADGSNEQMVLDDWLGAGWGFAPERTLEPDRLKGVIRADYALARARAGHTATALPRGLVLIAGGADGEASSPTEMLSIPGDASEIGSLLEARVDHSATLLPDGRVLVVGGRGGGGEHDWLSSAELWEWEPTSVDNPPSSRPAGSLAIGRGQHTATLLHDGRVLVIGGWGARDSVPISAVWEAELWDPRTESFSDAGSHGQPIAGHTATLLANGRALIVAQSAALWEPDSQSFRAVGPLLEERGGHTATLLPDGRVLIAGGYAGASALTSVEVFDPDAETFSPAGQLIEGRGGHTATLLLDGRVLIAGGDSGGPDSRVLASTELWDPRAEQSVSGPVLHQARTGHVALLRRNDDFSHLDQRVLMVGGRDADGQALVSAEEYHPFWLR
jgi:hypothetical protein